MAASKAKGTRNLQGKETGAECLCPQLPKGAAVVLEFLPPEVGDRRLHARSPFGGTSTAAQGD